MAPGLNYYSIHEEMDKSELIGKHGCCKNKGSNKAERPLRGISSPRLQAEKTLPLGFLCLELELALRAAAATGPEGLWALPSSWACLSAQRLEDVQDVARPVDVAAP